MLRGALYEDLHACDWSILSFKSSFAEANLHFTSLMLFSRVDEACVHVRHVWRRSVIGVSDHVAAGDLNIPKFLILL